MNTIYLHPLINTDEKIYLLGDIKVFEDREYKKKLIIRTKCSKPKKVDRKCALYVREDFDLSTLKILCIESNDRLSVHQAIIKVNKQQDYEFDLLAHLNLMNIQFSLSEGRITNDSRYIMYYNNPYLKSYGLLNSLHSNRIALDGTGDGELFYFYPDYFHIHHHPIYSILIHSYDIHLIYHALDEFINHNQGALTDQKFNELLDIIFEGNEVMLATDHFRFSVYRHYHRYIEVKTDNQNYQFDVHKLDQKNLYPSEVSPYEDEIITSYKQLLKDLFNSSEEQIANIIESYCQNYH